MPHINEREHKELLYKINIQQETIERLEKQLAEAQSRIYRLNRELLEHDRLGHEVTMEFND